MSPRRTLLMFASGVLVLALAHDISAQANPYRTIENFFKMPDGRKVGSTAGITIDRDGSSIWVFERCGGNYCTESNVGPVLKFDQSGNVVKSFGAGMFVRPHGIHIDREGNVWVSDGEGPDGKDPKRNGKGHQVFKFSPEGKLLMTLGKAGVAGDGPDTFNMPSAILVAPNGDIFIGDGHGGNSNARIVKFSKDGKFIKTWGKKGTGPGEFNVPHTIFFDSRGRLFVGDRGNHRIQIFDQDGNFLDQWTQFGSPSGMFIAPDDTLYVVDYNDKKRVFIGSAKDGSIKYALHDLALAEGVAVDRQGSIYVGETVPGKTDSGMVTGHMVRKLVKN